MQNINPGIQIKIILQIQIQTRLKANSTLTYCSLLFKDCITDAFYAGTESRGTGNCHFLVYIRS